MSRLLTAVIGSLLVAIALPAPAARAERPAAVAAVAGGGQAPVFTVPGGTVPQAPQRDGQQPPKPGTATLRGRVFAADSGQPLRKAQIRITSIGPGVTGQAPENRLATTDASGAYEFTELRAGRYNLNAQKGSFIALQYGQQRPFEPGKPLEILDGQTIEKIDFSLPRGGVITGRILDEFNEPISDVQVSAMRSQNAGGTRRLIQAGRAGMTNDIGEFRLFALPPGDYYVTATLRNNQIGDTNDRSGYAPTYYPGTADVASAQRLTVAVGQTVTDLTLSLLPTRTARVSGTAVDSQGHPLQGFVQALQQSTVVGGPFGISPGQIRPDGSFAINGLTPGDYTLQAQGPPPSPGTDPEFASADVTVQGTDVTGVRIAGAKASTIAGRVMITSGDPQSLMPSTVRISLFPAPNAGGNTVFFGPYPQPVAVNDDWSFQARARSGTMRVQTQGLQPPWNVKAVRYRGTDVTDSGLEVKPNEDLGELEIELTNRTTDISGTVTNGHGEPVKDYWAVLFAREPDKRRPPTRYARTARADQDGRFKATGLPPGEYLAIALDSVDPAEVTDPDFLGRIEARAERFALGEGETKTLDLKLNSLR
jgi:hypothetical protein